jgi:hypothetical protein
MVHNFARNDFLEPQPDHIWSLIALSKDQTNYQMNGQVEDEKLRLQGQHTLGFHPKITTQYSNF